MANNKELAIFVSGAAFVEVINHIVLALSNILPLQFMGLTISPQINYVLLTAWLLVLIFSLRAGLLNK